MSYEVTANSLIEAVQKASGRQTKFIRFDVLCAQAKKDYARNMRELREFERLLGRLEGRIKRLQGKLEDEQATASFDKAQQIFNIVGTVAALFPAFGAIRAGIAAAQAATGIARAIAATNSIGQALASVSLVSAFGIGLLKPSTSEQLSTAMNDLKILHNFIRSTSEELRRTLESARAIPNCDLTS